jgi:hypothetical protein
VRQGSLQHADPVVVPAADHDGVGHDLDARLGAHLLLELGADGAFRVAAPPQVPAELVLLLDEQHPRAGPGSRHRGRHPGRAASCD